jgi:hypothetical protein
MTKYYIDFEGNYLGAFSDEIQAPDDSAEVPFAPNHYLQRWDATNEEWLAPVFPNEVINKKKQAAYQSESDPLFFKWQRGEATEQEWLNKVAEIRARFE